MNNSNYQLFLKAKMLIKTKKINDAIEILRNLYFLEPYDNIIKFELAKCLLHSVKNKQDGKKILLELLNTQNRNYALLELGRLEVSEGNNSKARQYFEQLLNTQSKNYALLEMVFLDIKENNYFDAYDRFKYISNDTIFKNHYFDLKILLEYKLGIINQSDVLSQDYYISQLFNYDEVYALDHISRHLDENNNKIKHTLFNSDIDLKNLFYYVREQINYLNPVEISNVHKYIVECEFYVSTINGISTKHIKVVTLPNTNNILTMYPISYNEKNSGKTKKLIK